MSGKRYTTKEQIEADIDTALRLAQENLQRAYLAEQDIKAIQQKESPGNWTWLIDQKKEIIRRSEKRATRLLEGRCASLKAKLSEFMTMELPTLQTDGSIPVRVNPRPVTLTKQDMI